ncbi:unnamed protein product [Caenorhabditis auriculariae]|uniref:Uncharacterized protein n=1 Tax=Caenorhabditis auriculariae TaxID=2777116 RepID=A0A8S1H2F6_9PELO|nr:unnamed protein product [Caenorhabditis auriculariae]
MRKLLVLLLLCVAAAAAARHNTPSYDSYYPSYIDQICRVYCDKDPVLPKIGRLQFPPPPQFPPPLPPPPRFPPPPPPRPQFPPPPPPRPRPRFPPPPPPIQAPGNPWNGGNNPQPPVIYTQPMPNTWIPRTYDTTGDQQSGGIWSGFWPGRGPFG